MLLQSDYVDVQLQGLLHQFSRIKFSKDAGARILNIMGIVILVAIPSYIE